MKKIYTTLIFIAGTLTLSAQSCDAIPQNLTNGLLAFYPFTDGSTNDFSGNGHHLSNNTTTQSVADRNGSAGCSYHFSNSTIGSNEYLSTTDTSFLNGLSGMSVSLWFRYTVDQSAALRAMVSRGSATSCPDRTGQWSVGLYDINRAVFGRNDSVWQGWSPNAPSTLNVWQHAVGVYSQSGNSMKLYINGVLQESSTTNANCSNGQPQVLDVGDLLIGKRFSGDIDDVFIYNRPLSAAEVGSLYALGSCCNIVALSTAVNKAEIFSVSPNPVRDRLTLTGSGEAGIRFFQVYNSLGQMVIDKEAGNSSSVDVSMLSTGTYLLRIVSDSGSQVIRFVKE